MPLAARRARAWRAGPGARDFQCPPVRPRMATFNGRGVSRETGGGRAARRPRVARQRGSSAVEPSAERVPRETLEALVAQYDLVPRVAAKYGGLLAALAAEPDPHTTV